MNHPYQLTHLEDEKPQYGFLRRLWLKGANVNAETLSSDDKVHQLGLVYSIYRILVAVFLILSNYAANESIKYGIVTQVNILPSKVEYFFLGLYLLVGIGSALTLYLWQDKIRKQLFIGFLIDMFILTLLLYSGTTKDLQIVLLYMVSTAASFMMLQLNFAMIVALIGILSLVFQQLYYSYLGQQGFLRLIDSVVLSVSLMAVGFLSWSISQRLNIAENAAYINAKEIKRLNAINDQVIKNIVSGVIVISSGGRMVVINQVAEELLRLPKPSPNTSSTAYIFEMERQLAKKYKDIVQWYQYQGHSTLFNLTLPQQNNLPEKKIRIHKKHLPEYGQLLILEDMGREESHAQQLKLASLGQLSASIAHEIRNPLGAISQASELLMEDSNGVDAGSLELYKMIYNQSKRVNRIIEDVMRLSRQEPPKQQIIDLKQWLSQFLSQHYNGKNIAVKFQRETQIYFDPHHLEQIFINLINNALRHTKTLPNFADVYVIVHSDEQYILVDVLDNGDGVKPEDLEHLFNPFFTKSTGGTGLGLYLSKAFSEANHARLIYIPDHKKTCFRLMIDIINEDNHDFAS